MKPRLLDLFCGAGGSAMGYARAGFDVTGIDIAFQPRYPFRFVQGDALKPPVRLEDFDVIHASPPCQGYSRLRHLPWLRDREYPLLIEPTREMLLEAGRPYVIENVEDAPLETASSLWGTHGTWLCGQMFGLRLYRHRLFESSLPLARPSHPRHKETIFPGRLLNNRYRAGATGVLSVGGHATGNTREIVADAMGIDWMSRDEMNQAIPPAYTLWIGAQLLEQLERVA